MCSLSGGFDIFVRLCGLRISLEIFLLRRRRDLCGAGDVVRVWKIKMTQIHSCIAVYQWKVTVRHSVHTELYCAVPYCIDVTDKL
jgi:hypothetical protein